MPVTEGASSESLREGVARGERWLAPQQGGKEQKIKSSGGWKTHMDALWSEGQVPWGLVVFLNGPVSVVYGKHLWAWGLGSCCLAYSPIQARQSNVHAVCVPHGNSSNWWQSCLPNDWGLLEGWQQCVSSLLCLGSCQEFNMLCNPLGFGRAMF